MTSVSRLGVAALALACSARVAVAKDIVVEIPGERSTNNKLVIAGLTLAGGVAGALGVYWHLDGRSAANEVSANDFTGKVWNAERAALVERADEARTRATIAYGIGGALLVAAVITVLVTEPETTTTIIHSTPVPSFSPTEGGAVLGGVWSF